MTDEVDKTELGAIVIRVLVFGNTLLLGMVGYFAVSAINQQEKVNEGFVNEFESHRKMIERNNTSNQVELQKYENILRSLERIEKKIDR
jgi:hypothetical protein